MQGATHVITLETALGVDIVRELHRYAFQAGDGTCSRKIVISAPQVSFQAQNALLKMMEEAGERHMFLSLCSARN